MALNEPSRHVTCI